MTRFRPRTYRASFVSGVFLARLAGMTLLAAVTVTAFVICGCGATQGERATATTEPSLSTAKAEPNEGLSGELPFKLKKPIPVRLVTGRREGPFREIFAREIEFRERHRQLWAVLQITTLIVPGSEWRVGIDLLNETGDVLGHAQENLWGVGLISGGNQAIMLGEMGFCFGPWRQLSRTVKFRVSIEDMTAEIAVIQWGDPIEGVRARLRPTRLVSQTVETPRLSVDLKNEGQETVRHLRVLLFDGYFEVLYDGNRYEWGGGVVATGERELHPGQEALHAIEIDLTDAWRRKGEGRPTRKGESLKLRPGKHLILVRFAPTATPRVQALSNAVELEVRETPYILRSTSGNPKPTELPNGVTVNLPSWKTMRPDGSCFEGEGIKPDVLIAPSAEVFADRDPVLDKALELARTSSAP
jgi:hypothetical protein